MSVSIDEYDTSESRKQLQMLAINTHAYMQHVAYAINIGETILALYHSHCVSSEIELSTLPSLLQGFEWQLYNLLILVKGCRSGFE